METYNGHVRTPTDAIILFEACRLGLLPRVQRRLSEKERQSIRSGSVFVWDEREAGMRRWTDGKSWSASRVSGSFLTYREMEGKRGGNNFVQPVPSRGAKTPDSGRNSADDPADGEEGPDGYRYKPDGLMKQSFSITTTSGQHLHLISYYSRSHPTAPNLRQPSNDPTLASIQIPKGMYPESSVADQSNTPAVTRSPMPGAPNYAMAPSPAFARQPPPPPYAFYPGYFQHPAGFIYPVSPMHTPPGYPMHAYAPLTGLPPPPGHPSSPFAPPHPPQPPPPPLNHAPPSAYDQRPLRNSIPTPGEARTPTTLQHATTAPSGYSAQTSHSPLTPSHTASQYQGSTESALSAPQIDPRLTDFTAANSATPPVYSSAPAPTPASAPASVTMNPLPSPKSIEHSTHSTVTEITVTASQVPTIGALVNETSSTPSLAKGLSTVTTTEISIPTRKDNDRAGSSSPGGTKHSVPPQDIPSEKLGFREDMRALSKLDRVFARV